MSKEAGDPVSAPLTSEDEAILDGVDQAILQGKALQRWWKRKRESGCFSNRFPVSRQAFRPDMNYGFLEDAVLPQGILPVAGVIQDQLFDFPKVPKGMKSAEPQWIRGQVEEFIMRYFMRLTYALAPAPAAQRPAAQPAHFLQPLSRCRTGAAESYGWGYEQCYYKLEGSGQVGKFPEAERREIIDLRQIGSKYSWVVFKVNIFHFDVAIYLAGSNGPKLLLPWPQSVYTVLTPNFLVNQENPRPGVLGEYGYGYSVVPDPNVHSLVAAGPSSITNTIETLHFRVLESGEVRAHMDFITPQPPRILDIDPVGWGFRLADLFTQGMASSMLAPLKQALETMQPQIDPVYMGLRMINLMTAGSASEDFCINKEQMFKELMVLHFGDVFNMYNLSAAHFRMVPDWTDEESLPEWAKGGTFGEAPEEGHDSHGEAS